jgi:hypothetical protein
MKLSCLIWTACRLDNASSAFIAAELHKRYPGKIFLPLSAYEGIPRPPQRQELRELLQGQSVAALYMLLTLWRLGRGEFSLECDLLDEYLETADIFPCVHDAVNYLMGKYLSRYLENALHLLQLAGMDVDGLLE